MHRLFYYNVNKSTINTDTYIIADKLCALNIIQKFLLSARSSMKIHK